MRRIKLVVAYDGTGYHGWQLQKNGETIESVLNRELTKLFGETIQVIGASRTDSGVHALGNVAVFDTGGRMPADKICFALNARLPEDIRVQSSEEVSPGWHPRKCNCTKTYEYRILNRKIGLPIYRNYAYFCHQDLDLERMREAAACLVGEHDFKSFCASGSSAEDTVRIIYSVEVEKREDLITIRIRGNGFLYNMVRIIAGTLMRVGKGSLTPQQVGEILLATDRREAWDTAPAKGLTLVGLDYETELPDWLESRNEHWEYRMLQSHIRDQKCAWLLVERCCDEQFQGLVERNLKRAVRNGAETIYLADKESSRICAGEQYGYCRVEFMDPERMEKAGFGLSEEEWVRLAGKTGISAVWYQAKPCK